MGSPVAKMTSPDRPTIVLVGAGHAHLHIANQAADYADAGAQLVLIDPGKFWYSGMATGLLGGRYAPEDDQIDPGALIRRRGGRFIQDRVEAVDTSSRRISLGSGETIDYDWLSLNVGSEVDIGGLEPADNGPRIWPVKPIPPLYELRQVLEQAMRDTSQMPAVVVIGGGATGSELSANLAGLAALVGQLEIFTVPPAQGDRFGARRFPARPHHRPPFRRTQILRIDKPFIG